MTNSNSGSVAPKERVNIVYKPATGDVREEVELPLKLLVLGDFFCREDSRPIEDRQPININKDDFDEVLKAHEVSMQLSVPNSLVQDEGCTLDVSLTIETMKDFEPDQVVQQVPELKKLLELRDALRSLKGPLSNVPEFRRKIHNLISDESVRDRLLDEIGISGKEY